MKTYHVFQNGQRVGPFSIEQLAQLYQNGSLDDEAKVTTTDNATPLKLIELLKPHEHQPHSSPSIEAAQPTPDDSFEQLLRQASPSKGFERLVTSPSQAITKLIQRLRPNLQKTDKLRHHWELLGHAGLLSTAALLIIWSLIRSFTNNSFKPLLYGWSGAIALLICQYIALNALKAIHTLIEKTARPKSNTIIYDAVGIFYIFAGICTCGIIYKNALDHYEVSFGPSTVFLAAIVLGGLFYIYLGIAVAAFNPHLVNIHDKAEVSTPQEAISLLTWNINAWLYIAPIFYGLLSVVGTISIIINLTYYSTDSSWAWIAQRTLGYMWFGSDLRVDSAYSFALIYIGALSPLFMYIFSLLTHLSIGLFQAVISIAARHTDHP